jgi:hypothetical protein
LPALWVREVLCEGGALRDVLFERIGPQCRVMARAKFARRPAARAAQPSLDPRLLVISLVGLTLFLRAGAPIWRRTAAGSDIDCEALRHHAIALARSGLVAAVREERCTATESQT